MASDLRPRPTVPDGSTINVLADLEDKLRYCHWCCCVAAAVAVAGVVLVMVAVGKWKTTCRVLLSSFLFLPCSHFLLPYFSPSASSAELRASSRRGPVRLLSWLLARFVDGLAPSACVVRCSHGSTKRFSKCHVSVRHFVFFLH